VLASASPRRRAILQTLHVPCRVVPSRVDETRREGEGAIEWVARAARDKATEVAGRLREERPAPFVLGADTVVLSEGNALGKPADDDDARRMLASLSVRWHEVVTAVALVRRGAGVLGERRVHTQVRFRELGDDEIDGYVASGEPRDKAGAYAVQGLGGGLVAAIEGSYHNVVGLPAAETIGLLREHAALERWP